MLPSSVSQAAAAVGERGQGDERGGLQPARGGRAGESGHAESLV